MELLRTIFAWLLVGVLIVAAYPSAVWLLRRTSDEGGFWLKAVVTLGFSIGALTLLMFWEALLGLRLSLWGVTLPYILLMLPGISWLWRVGKNTSKAKQNATPFFERFSKMQLLIITAIVMIAAGILFNAAYWPFHKEDVIGIYGRYGKLMYESGTLVPFAGRDDAFYQAYPILIPLSHTFTFLATGWENEYLARVIPALLALATLPATCLLGSRLYSNHAGLLSALLLVLTPAFVRWASSGYTDLPMAFFYTMAALFSWRLWEKDNPTDALLAGVTIGLAAWTKNAALPSIFFFSGWMMYALLMRRIMLKSIAFVVLACTVIAAPWYARNWVEARLIMPPTAWTDQAQRTLANLLVFITKPENFAFTGWLVMLGGIAALAQLARRKEPIQARLLLLVLSIPFFGIWWLLVSYDPRFLLLFLPLLVVIAAGESERLWNMLPQGWRSKTAIPLIVLMLGMAAYMLWSSIEFKDEILRNPLMDDATKKAIVLAKPDN